MDAFLGRRAEPVKSTGYPASKRTGGKLNRNQPLPVEVALTNKAKAPNMSRKNQSTKIYSFPAFDKCDSLVFFPAMIASYLNSGDFNNLGRLMKSRIDRNCVVSLCSMETTVPMFVKIFQCANEVFPDMIMCLHTTKVVGNEIRSVLYFKFTENRPLRDALLRDYPDQVALSLCTPPTANLSKVTQFLAAKSAPERDTIAQMIDEASEVEVYGINYLTLKVDQYTKTVRFFGMDSEFTSFRAGSSSV